MLENRPGELCRQFADDNVDEHRELRSPHLLPRDLHHYIERIVEHVARLLELAGLDFVHGHRLHRHSPNIVQLHLPRD